MTSRPPVSAVVMAVLALSWPVSAGAGKFPKVGVKCSKQTELRVDVHGNRDVCAAFAPADCPSGLALRVDADGPADVCTGDPQEPPSEQTPKPTCPSKFELVTGEGEDVCQRSEKPHCRKGYKMKIGKGPDMCERG